MQLSDLSFVLMCILIEVVLMSLSYEVIINYV